MHHTKRKPRSGAKSCAYMCVPHRVNPLLIKKRLRKVQKIEARIAREPRGLESRSSLGPSCRGTQIILISSIYGMHRYENFATKLWKTKCWKEAPFWKGNLSWNSRVNGLLRVPSQPGCPRVCPPLAHRSYAPGINAWWDWLVTRVQIHLKILYSNFLFIHHEADVGIWIDIVKNAIQAEICVAKCLKCGAFCSAIQSNLHPADYTSRLTPTGCIGLIYM